MHSRAQRSTANCSVAPTPQKMVVTDSDSPPSGSRHSRRFERAKSRSIARGCSEPTSWRTPLSGTPRFSTPASRYTPSRISSEGSTGSNASETMRPAWPSSHGLTRKPPRPVPSSTAVTAAVSIQALAATSWSERTSSVASPYLAGA